MFVTNRVAVLIAGPTASGKSALAMQMAREKGGVIINADAIQVYRELRILSARPSVVEEATAPHRLYGHVSGGEDYSVARWLADARHEIQAVWGQGRIPIICGGTGLYFRALEHGLAEVPEIPQALRDNWRTFAGDLHGELLRRDPVMAARLKPADRHRVVRALEVIEATGRSLLDWQKDARENSFFNNVNVKRLFVNVPREELYQRADTRFEAMIASGALDEIRSLPPLAPERPMMKAIGVPELSSHLRGEISLAEAVAQAELATRHYIKRQLTWWRPRLDRWEQTGA